MFEGVDQSLYEVEASSAEWKDGSGDVAGRKGSSVGVSCNDQVRDPHRFNPGRVHAR